MKKIYTFLLCTTLIQSLHSHSIDNNGFWVGDVQDLHMYDKPLSSGLVLFFTNEQPDSIVDFGCGLGDYASHLNENGLNCACYDGNPETPTLTKGRCNIVDLSTPFQLENNFDWVMSLEVGEHLPPQFETIFIENLIKHAKKGIVLSWAVEGQPGHGHVNCKNNDYIKSIMANYGLTNDEESENFLRKHSTFSWFKNTIMVFRK